MKEHHIRKALALTLMSVGLTAFTPTMAQAPLPKDAYPVIVAPHNQTVSYRERTLCFELTTNVDFTATTQADWISVRKGAGSTVYVHLAQNGASTSRQGTVTFANADKGISETLTITQGRDESIEDLTADTKVKVTSVKAADKNGNTSAISQPGNPATNMIDGDYSTMWHTNWNNLFNVTESNPAVLTFTFTGVKHIDYINYVTRNSGGNNGNFLKVEVYVRKTGMKADSLVTTSEMAGSQGTYRIDLGKTGIDDPTQIVMKVLSGSSDQSDKSFASCGEMEFYVDNRKDIFGSVFADEALTTLKEGATQADIDKISDEYVASIAQLLFDGKYDKAYRVGKYKAVLSPQTQSDLWNAPGKYYDQTQGVTGINISKGKHAIAVSGLADGQTLPLTVVAWYVGKMGSNFDGGNPESQNFQLRNGLNVIDYTQDYDGLAYVCYYADANPELQPEVTVHFINGQVNGYLSLDKTNEEMHDLIAKAPNLCMDVVGTHVHSVWSTNGINGKYSKGLLGACVAEDGTSLGYRQFMHVLDSLVIWEHNLLGFAKYNRLPDNRTMAYVNFTYYMFQGGRGVSFIVSEENRVLSCRQLIDNDNDAIWGLSHEWGHQHQMHPYFCWAGMGEVTNNMNSYYNIMRMGYRTSDKIAQWKPARQHFIDEKYLDITPSGTGKVGNLNSNMRSLAYKNASETSYSKPLQDFVLTMKDSLIRQPKVNEALALSINEVGVGEILCPFVKLYAYFTTHGFPDFAPDWYESLRQNDDENGSQIEKQGAVDKYELIASAQNGNKNGKYALLAKNYPNSVWVKNNYVRANSTTWQNSMPYVLNFIRKTSRLSGYNLVPYFEKWGFLRRVALLIGDYGNKWIILTPDMYDEFVKDMDALNLKPVSDQMVKEISNTPEMFQTRPTFPN